MGGQGTILASGLRSNLIGFPSRWLCFGQTSMVTLCPLLQAGVNGYEETRSREEGAVKIAPVQPPATSSTSSTTGLNTDAIIAQVTQAKVDLLQPIIPRFWPPSDQRSRRLSPSLSRADKSCLSLWQKVLSTNIFNAQPAFSFRLACIRSEIIRTKELVS